MRLVLLTLLFAACGRPSTVPFGVAQECRVRIPAFGPAKLDWLIVIDDSPAMQPRLAAVADLLDRLMNEVQSQVFRRIVPYWLHLGVATADPADGAALRGGCGLGAERAFIDDNAEGGVSNLAPGQTLASTLRCLLPSATGALAQRPLETAFRVAVEPIEANHEFRRDEALLLILWIAAADYDEDAATFALRFAATRARGGVAVDPNEVILESLSTGGANLNAVVMAAFDHVELPLDITDAAPLLEPLTSIITSHMGVSGCLSSPPLDPARPNCSVEDVTVQRDGTSRITELPKCSAARWIPPCWELLANQSCRSGTRVSIRRPPEGAPLNTTSSAGCDCVAASAADLP